MWDELNVKTKLWKKQNDWILYGKVRKYTIYTDILQCNTKHTKENKQKKYQLTNPNAFFMYQWKLFITYQ